LINNDCLKAMDELIAQGVIVDAIITDPPYWITACKWDSVIPFDKMWERLNKLIKPNGAIVLFWSEPFSSALRISNIKNYKYDWKWKKERWTWFATSWKRPLKIIEDILVFYKKQPLYQAEWKKLDKPYKHVLPLKKEKFKWVWNMTKSIIDWKRIYKTYTHTTPHQLLEFSRDNWCRNSLHPTQKPVALMEYLIKTYTNEWETVLDFTMWSWSTGVACKNTNRKFIGIELDKDYFNIANQRISWN
jgi:site-specific DNA-methyltransferase (adenine-specific)